MDSSDDDDDDESDEDIDVDVDGDIDDEVLSELIDIREPLGQLKQSLEARLGYSLKNYDFWLQDTQMLSDEITLVDQCIQGEGLVQIKVEVANGKINIVDVLKPEEDLMSDDVNTEDRKRRHSSGGASKALKVKKEKLSSDAPKSAQPEKPVESVTRWVVSSSFRREQERLNFPTDPLTWDRLHVAHWLNWVKTEFPNSKIEECDWEIDGRELCSLSHDEFKKKVPVDPSDTLWTHLELLRKCKFVAVIQHSTRPVMSTNTEATSAMDPSLNSTRKTFKKPPIRLGAEKYSLMQESAPGNRSGNNGQVQLWQFLLELLTDKEHCDVIHWVGEDGEFKLESPEIVAQLWGNRKNKPSMNYEKLSRALRYYYDGDMISKVHGKRFAYKFVCNLKELIGYDASELSRLVKEAQMKSMGSISVYRD